MWRSCAASWSTIQPIRSTFSPFRKQAYRLARERDKSRNAAPSSTPRADARPAECLGRRQRPDLRCSGFHALATTSAGSHSAWLSDGERISRDEDARAVAASTAIPFDYADMEGGYGQTPDAVAETVRRVIEAGAVGMNLEDRMERASDRLLQAVERVAGSASGRRRGWCPFGAQRQNRRVRSHGDCPRPSASPRRCGAATRPPRPADSVFVPFVGDRDTIEQLVQQTPRAGNIPAHLTRPTLKELAASACVG